jgi:hypothetical protein
MKPKSKDREKSAPTCHCVYRVDYCTNSKWPARPQSARQKLLNAIDLARRATASDPQNVYCRQATLILDKAFNEEAGNEEA